MTPDLHGCLKSILADRSLAADPTPNGEVRLRERQAHMTATVVGLSAEKETERLAKMGTRHQHRQEPHKDINMTVSVGSFLHL